MLTPLAITLALLQDPSDALAIEVLPWERTSDASSAFPSWTTGSADPRWLETLLGADDIATLRVCAIDGERTTKVELISGEGWFLNWADFPAAASLPDGTMLWTWLERAPGESLSYGTRFQVSSPYREEPSEPRRLEDHQGPGEHGFVSLAPLGEKRFLAIWLDGRDAFQGGDMRLLSRTIDPGGELGPELLVDPRTCSCCPTALVRLENGTLLAAWRDRSEEEVRDISLARFDGRVWSEPVGLNEDGWQIDGCPVNGPRLAADSRGVAATWYTGAGDGAVLVAFGDPGGRAFGRPLRVDEGAPMGRGDGVFLADGSFLVGWMEHGRQLSSWRVRRIARSGELGPSQIISEIDSGRSSGFLRLAREGDGAVLAFTRTLPERRVVLRKMRPPP